VANTDSVLLSDIPFALFYKFKHNNMSDSTDLRRLLRPDKIAKTKTEEDRHPWGSSNYESFQVPLLRIRDDYSGSPPDENNIMLARADGERLDTFDIRKKALETHADHSKWEPTPFISFSSSPDAIQSLASYRTKRRGQQWLTVIDPNVRLRSHWPILRMDTEMKHYGVQSPYLGRNYYEHHYICLWKVDAAEIVGHWDWNELKDDPQWYQNIVIPAFRKFAEFGRMISSFKELSAAINRFVEDIDRLSRKSTVPK
jgi:hypothetical protein